MAFSAGEIEATLTLNRNPFTAGLAAARSQAKSFANDRYEATASIKVDQTSFNAAVNQLRDFARQSRSALARVNVDRLLFDKLVHDLREFGRQTYTARAKVDIDTSGGILQDIVTNLGKIGDVADRTAGRLVNLGSQGGQAFSHMDGGARAVLTTLPLLLPAAGAAVTGIIGLVGSLASIFAVAGAGAAAFGLVAGPVFTKISDAAKLSREEIAKLPPGIREGANALKSLTEAYDGLVARTQANVGLAMAAGFDAASAAVRTLDPLINATATTLVAIGRDIQQYFGTAHWATFVNFLSANVGPVFTSLWDIVKNLTRAVMDLVIAFMPMGQWLLGAIANGMREFAQWASTLANDPKFHAWVELAKQALTAFWGLLVEVVKFLFNFATALAPLGTAIFDILRMVFEGLNKLPPAWLQAIAAGIVAIGAAIAFGPQVGLAVGIIFGLAAAFTSLYNSSEPFRQVINNIWADLQSRFIPVFQDLWRELTTKVGPALEDLRNFFETRFLPAFEKFYFAVAPIIEWLIRVVGTELVDTFKATIQIIEGLLQILTGAFNVVSGLLTGDWSLMWQGIKDIAEGALNIILSLFGVKLDEIVGWFQNDFAPAFTSGWNSFWGGIGQGWNDFWGTIGGWFAEQGQGFADEWNSFWTGVADAYETVKTTILDSWHGFWVGLLDGLGLNGEQIVAGWQQQWNQMWLDVSLKWGEILAGWTQFWTDVFAQLTTGGQQLVDGWNSFWAPLVEATALIWEAIKTGWTEFWTFIFDAVATGTQSVVDAWNTFWDGVKLKADEIQLAIITAWNDFWAQFQGSQETGQATSSQSWGEWFRVLGETVGTWIQTVIQFFAGLPGQIAAALGSIVATVTGVFANMAAGVISTVTGFIATVVSNFQQLPGRIVAAITRIIADLRNTFTQAVAGAIQAATSGIANLVSLFSGLPGRLISALGNIAARFVQIGRDIIQGMIQGIQSAVSGLVAAAVNAATSAFNAAKQALGIASPSKLFRDEIGKQIGAGLVEGIRATIPEVERAMADLTTMVSPINETASPIVELDNNQQSNLDAEIVSLLQEIRTILDTNGTGATINLNGTGDAHDNAQSVRLALRLS